MTSGISDEERQALIARAQADLAAARAEAARRAASGEPPPRISTVKGRIHSGAILSWRPRPDGSTESYEPSAEERWFIPRVPGDEDRYGNLTEQFYARHRTIAQLAAALFGDETSTQVAEADVRLVRTADGAVVEYPDGSRVWRDRRWRLHRTDGPASECPDGKRAWFVEGRLHRVDGPAFELADGSREWWVGGRRHRLDGPASEWADGARVWRVDGERHRVDGPAVEWPDGSREWWLNGVKVTEDEVLRVARLGGDRGRRPGGGKHE